MALWDEHLGVGVWRKGPYDVVCDGNYPLDDHFPTVDGVSARGAGSSEMGACVKVYLRETTSPFAMGRPE